MQLDETIMPSLNVGGRGGKEKMLASAFPDYIFVNESLYDFQHREDPTDMLEVKKQANCQWFDVGKYHDLSAAQRQIKMTFILHEDGRIQNVFYIPLGDMLDLLCSDPAYRKHGWTQQNIEECAIQKLSYSTMQVKVKLAVKSFYKKHQDRVKTVYASPNI